MRGKVTYITLSTSDLDATVAFYESVFRWPRHRRVQSARFFEMANITVALMDAKAFARFTNIAETDLHAPGSLYSWNVDGRDEVDGLIDRAVASGAAIVREVAKLDWGCWAGIIRTPDGHLWEIVWNPKQD